MYRIERRPDGRRFRFLLYNYGMKTFSTQKAIHNGWMLWKKHKKLLTLSTLLVFLFSMKGDERGRFHGGGISSLLLSLVYTFLSIGWLRINLKIFDHESASIHDLFGESKLFWRYVGATLLYTLGTAVGLILFIIPGIYFIIKYQFVFFFLVDKHMSITESFHHSARLTHGVKWKLLGFIIAMLAINILGALCLGAGLLVSMPVSMLASVSVYRKLLEA